MPTATGTLIGTVAYLSPEQIERGAADQRSDVYAAGILLYECLTGHQPHGGETPLQIAYQHVHSDVPAPSASRPGLAPALDQLVARATCRNPLGRPADAGAFLHEVLAVRRSLSARALDDDTGSTRRPVDVNADTEAVAYGGHRAGAPQPTTPIGSDPAFGGAGRRGPIAVPARFARRRSRGVLALAAVLTAALALGLGGWRLAMGATVDTPSLISLSKDAALAKARTSGLQVRFADGGRFSENVAAGEVISTDPLPGHPVAEHGWVTAILSKGPERIAVPNGVVGAGLDDAKQQLVNAGLTLGAVTHSYSDTVGSGQVISTDPQVGTALKRGAVVNFVVSDGGKPTRLPDTVGQFVDEATPELERLGFVVSVKQVDSLEPAGQVLAQDPDSGARSPAARP